MKKYLVSILSGVLATSAGAGMAQAQEEETTQTFAPVETFSCYYNEGKGPMDLDKAIAAWNKYADSQGITDYFAMTITPHYFSSNTGSFDIGWLGVWPDGTTMGVDYDKWFSTGQKAAAGIYEVLNCDSHANFASLRIKAPASEKAPQKPVIVFSDCDVLVEGSWDPVFEALDAWAAYQTERGYENGTWALFPAYGGGGDTPDFKLVQSYANHAALGKAYDLYGNGGDYKKRGEMMNGIVDCDVSRVYNGNVVRRAAEDE